MTAPYYEQLSSISPHDFSDCGTRQNGKTGARMCFCGSLEGDSVHRSRSPDTRPNDWKTAEARRLGERDEGV